MGKTRNLDPKVDFAKPKNATQITENPKGGPFVGCIWNSRAQDIANYYFVSLYAEEDILYSTRNLFKN